MCLFRPIAFETAQAPINVGRDGQSRIRHQGWVGLILALAALMSRVQFLGNPVLDSDEGFYLFVGGRMLHGALPYVDIWDRKPVGLFLLYAAMRFLGGDGVIAYQLVGTAFAAATAFLIVLVSREITNRFGALAAGSAYLIWLTLGSANGGQAELFYGLPVCAAALVTMRGLQRSEPHTVWWRGSLAMILIGLAAQIKYNVLFEGAFFGCCWLLIGWRFGLRSKLIPYAVLWVSLALGPTLLAALFYAARGQLGPFLFANFVSIWHRHPGSTALLAGRLAWMALILGPLLACVRPASTLIEEERCRIAFRFTLCWLAISILSVLAFGTYLEQYLLPILIPASIGAGPCLGRAPRRYALAILFGFFLLGQAKLYITQIAHGSEQQLAAINRQIDKKSCLYVYSGLSTLYRVADTCIPTKYAFPSHLSRAREAAALGVDPAQEVTRIMRTKPGTVIVREPYEGDENGLDRAIVMDFIKRRYHLVYHGLFGWHHVDVYRTRTYSM